MLSVVETFDSIQGEGFYSGFRSFFVRLAGCDIGCHWCDEKKSWNKKDYPQIEVNQLVERCLPYMNLLNKNGHHYRLHGLQI